MAVIRDINEYRLCAKNFNSPIVDRLFAVLWALSNLLLVKPANLQEICSEDPLVNIINIQTQIKHIIKIMHLYFLDITKQRNVGIICSVAF